MSRKNAAVVSFRWLSASSFCSCFTRSSLSVVPRQLNWCSKCWSRSLLRSMIAASRTALEQLDGAQCPMCRGLSRLSTCCQPRSLFLFFVVVVVVVSSVADFKCHSLERHSICVRTVHICGTQSRAVKFWSLATGPFPSFLPLQEYRSFVSFPFSICLTVSLRRYSWSYIYLTYYYTILI